MKAMVLSAGYGTRFRPVTRSLPKPLVPLCNRPLIGWAIDSLIDFGVREIAVNLHHLPGPLRAWLDREYRGRCEFHYSLESEILGTGGGLRRCKSFFEGEDSFLVINSDTVQFPPYQRLIETLRVSEAPVAMLLRRPPESDRFTGVWYDEGRVSSIGVEGEGESLMFSGAHAMTPEVFDFLPNRDVSGLTEDLYAPLLRRGVGVGATIDDGVWFDVGTPLRYMEASEGLLNAISRGEIAAPLSTLLQPLQQVLVDSRAVVEGHVMRSTICEDTIVARGSQLVDSAVWSGVRIGESALVEESILSDGVAIPAGAVVRNALVCRREDDAAADDSTTKVGELEFVPIDRKKVTIVEPRLDG